MIEKINSTNNDILDLNVGGAVGIQVSKNILCQVPETPLESMFSGRFNYKKIEGKIFVDRDPDIFKLIINYMRNKL